MIVLLALYVYLSIVIFDNFSGTSPVAIGSTSIVITVMLTILVYLKVRPDGVPLTSLIINLYSLYLVWSGLSSNDDPLQNKYLSNN